MACDCSWCGINSDKTESLFIKRGNAAICEPCIDIAKTVFRQRHDEDEKLKNSRSGNDGGKISHENLKE